MIDKIEEHMNNSLNEFQKDSKSWMKRRQWTLYAHMNKIKIKKKKTV
jgi:hypothetical protein